MADERTTAQKCCDAARRAFLLLMNVTSTQDPTTKKWVIEVGTPDFAIHYQALQAFIDAQSDYCGWAVDKSKRTERAVTLYDALAKNEKQHAHPTFKRYSGGLFSITRFGNHAMQEPSEEVLKAALPTYEGGASRKAEGTKVTELSDDEFFAAVAKHPNKPI